MKSYINKIIITTLFSFFFVMPVHAAILDVTFNPDPLFNASNFLPGDDEVGEATVNNTSGSEQTVITEAINILDDDGFGSKLSITIEDGSGVVYTDGFNDFLANGEVTLGTLGDGSSETYTFTVFFNDDDDNTYQGKTLGFDLCVGFEGGDLNCGGTEIGNPGNPTPPGGGGGGGPIAPHVLHIENERVSNIEVGNGIPGDGLAVIEWDTNLLATSRVIYGLSSDGPNYPACLTSGPCYNLDLLNTPNYGFPFSTIEDGTKVLHHIVNIPGLIPGEEYSFRVVSHASPDTVGFEYKFSLVYGETPTTPPTTPGGGGGGVAGTATIVAEGGVVPELFEEDVEENNLQPAAALFGLPEGLFNFTLYCAIIFLLLLLLMYLLWRIFDRLTDRDRSKYTDKERTRRYFIFMTLADIIIIALAILLNYLCVVLPLLLILIVLLAFVIWTQREKNRELPIEG